MNNIIQYQYPSKYKFEHFNILKTGSLLWKFACMNGFSIVERVWKSNDKRDSFMLCFKNIGQIPDIMRACSDEMRPVSTCVDITFNIDNSDDVDNLDNDTIFDLIADVVEEKNVNIIAGKDILWKKGISKEEMLVKMDLLHYFHIIS